MRRENNENEEEEEDGIKTLRRENKSIAEEKERCRVSKTLSFVLKRATIIVKNVGKVTNFYLFCTCPPPPLDQCWTKLNCFCA